MLRAPKLSISAYFEAARELGTLLGQCHIRLINGAGGIGLISATADAVPAAGGEVTGVIPHFMVEQGWQHKGLTDEVENMHQRKQKMADLSDAVIALPGGCGDFWNSVPKIITWKKQLGLYLNPIVILNTNGFFDPLWRCCSVLWTQSFNETAARCQIPARSKHSAGSRRTDSYHTCLDIVPYVSLRQYDRVLLTWIAGFEGIPIPYSPSYGWITVLLFVLLFHVSLCIVPQLQVPGAVGEGLPSQS